MKIALFAQCMYPPWIEGIKNNSLLLIKELAKDVDIEVISHKPPEGKNQDDELAGISVHYLLQLSDNPITQLWFIFVGGIKSLLFINKKKISLVLFQYLETSYLFPMLLLWVLKWKTQFILTIYSTDEVTLGYKRLFLRIFRKKFRKIIIISEYLRPYVRELGFEDEDILYIPISFDKKRYGLLAPWEKRREKNILFSAGPIEAAGSFFMVEVAKQLPDYHFIFAMRQFNKKSENEMNLLTRRIEESGVKNIEIRRNIDHMEALLGEVSAFVLPLQDIHIKMLIPVALLEAMARGTVCFVSDLPNLSLLVQDGENAILFKKEDPVELSNKIRTFIKYKDMALRAHDFGISFPDYPDIAKQYFSLIKHLLNDKT